MGFGSQNAEAPAPGFHFFVHHPKLVVDLEYNIEKFLTPHFFRRYQEKKSPLKLWIHKLGFTIFKSIILGSIILGSTIFGSKDYGSTIFGSKIYGFTTVASFRRDPYFFHALRAWKLLRLGLVLDPKFSTSMVHGSMGKKKTIP